MRLYIIIIFASLASLARSQHVESKEKPSKLEALSGMKPESESHRGFFSFGAETDIDAGARDKFCLRLSGQVSDMKEENFLAFGAMPGFRSALSKNFVFEVEAGPGMFLIQEKFESDAPVDPEITRSHPEILPSAQIFSRLAYNGSLYGEAYFINAFKGSAYVQHVKAEAGFLRKRWNPFLSYDTLYRLAVGTRYEVGKNAMRFNPGLGLAWSGTDFGAVFSVKREF